MSTALWDDLARWLARAGVTRVCGSVGEGTGLLESAATLGGLEVRTAPGPKPATHAAHGIAIARGEPVAVWVPAGPGIAGAVPALLEAYSARVPLLVFCPGTARGQRDSGAFQHVDVQRLVAPLTRYRTRVEVAEELPGVLDTALRALRHRGGPALVEIPADLQEHRWLGDTGPPLPVARPRPAAEALARLVELLDGARRPVLLLGGGCDRSAGRAAAELGRDHGVAVLTTAAARGLVDENEPHALGVAGLYMTDPVAELVRDADLVLAVGTALEETARWTWAAEARDRIAHVDVDAAAFARGVRPDTAVVSDAAAALHGLLAEAGRTDRDSWRTAVGRTRERLLSARHDVAGSPVRAMLLALQEVLDDDAVLVLENGLSDMWAYHFPALVVGSGHTLVVPAEQTGLGFAVPAAAGVAADDRSRQVVAVVGDGAFRAGQDGLDLLAAAGAGLLLVVIENGGYGWPRLEQRRHGVDVGCDLRVDLPAEVAVRWPAGRVWRPDTESPVGAAMKEAAAHAAAGGLAVVGVRTGWDTDLPDAIRELVADG